MWANLWVREKDNINGRTPIELQLLNQALEPSSMCELCYTNCVLGWGVKAPLFKENQVRKYISMSVNTIPKPLPKIKGTITLKQAEEKYGYKVQFLRDHKHEIGYSQRTRLIVFKVSDLEKWLERFYVEPNIGTTAAVVNKPLKAKKQVMRAAENNLTKDQAAKLLNTTPRNINRWMLEGKLIEGIHYKRIAYKTMVFYGEKLIDI